jgi:hypothetical protein
MHFDREAVDAKGNICKGVLTPRPPKGGVREGRHNK